MREIATPTRQAGKTRLRSFRISDLSALVHFWNVAFADQPNFRPFSEATFRQRILECPAFDPAGLMLAWYEDTSGAEMLVGLVHAFRPPPDRTPYREWGRHHFIAVLYVAPKFRRQGIGSRLLQAAENWLYYCPVYLASQAQPCYGTLESAQPPPFGSPQRMGISASNRGFIRFAAKHGYVAVDPGDVTMTCSIPGQRWPKPVEPDLPAMGLHLLRVSNQNPFAGSEPPGRGLYGVWDAQECAPYSALVLADRRERLQAQIGWFPLSQDGMVAVGSFWVTPSHREKGLGSYLLDLALHEITTVKPKSRYDKVQVHTHLIQHAKAVEMYRKRGFEVTDAWVNLVKT